MNSKYKNRQHLLISLLKPLVSEWGFFDVINALDYLKEELISNEIGRGEYGGINKPISTSKKTRKNLISKLIPDEDIPEEKYDLILTLAEKFSKKDFLPRISDVRNFVEIHGSHHHNFKQRSEAFKLVVQVLYKEPTKNLEKILKDSQFSTPTELGPLSDAISSAGAAQRSVPVNFYDVKKNNEENILTPDILIDEAAALDVKPDSLEENEGGDNLVVNSEALSKSGEKDELGGKGDSMKNKDFKPIVSSSSLGDESGESKFSGNPPFNDVDLKNR